MSFIPLDWTAMNPRNSREKYETLCIAYPSHIVEFNSPRWQLFWLSGMPWHLTDLLLRLYPTT